MSARLTETMVNALADAVMRAAGHDYWQYGITGKGTRDALVRRGLLAEDGTVTEDGRAELRAALANGRYVVWNAAAVRALVTPRFELRPSTDPQYPADTWVSVWDTVLDREATRALVEFAADDVAELTESADRAAVDMVDGVAVWTLPDWHDHGSAYGFTQTHAAFNSGDVLVVPGGRGVVPVVVVMYDAWPVAVTEGTTEFERFNADTDWSLVDGGRWADAYRVAVAVAERRGLPVLPNGTNAPEARQERCTVIHPEPVPSNGKMVFTVCELTEDGHTTHRDHQGREWTPPVAGEDVGTPGDMLTHRLRATGVTVCGQPAQGMTRAGGGVTCQACRTVLAAPTRVTPAMVRALDKIDRNSFASDIARSTLDALVRRGLVVRAPGGRHFATDAGREVRYAHAAELAPGRNVTDGGAR